MTVRCQQQGSHRHVSHGRDHHGKFRLHRISSPGHAGQKRGEAEAQLCDHQRQHQDRRAADGLDLRIDRQGADCRPRQHERDNYGMDHVRPPTQPVVTEHRPQDQLNVEHENRKQRQGEQAGTPLVEFDSRLLFNPFLAGEERHGHGDAEKCLRQVLRAPKRPAAADRTEP